MEVERLLHSIQNDREGSVDCDVVIPQAVAAIVQLERTNPEISQWEQVILSAAKKADSAKVCILIILEVVEGLRDNCLVFPCLAQALRLTLQRLQHGVQLKQWPSVLEMCLLYLSRLEGAPKSEGDASQDQDLTGDSAKCIQEFLYLTKIIDTTEGKLKPLLEHALLRLLLNPLAKFDIKPTESHDEAENRATECAREAVAQLRRSSPDAVALAKDSFESDLSTVGVGLLFYVQFSGDLNMVPYCYHPVELFRVGLALFRGMVAVDMNNVIVKGLDLLNLLLLRIDQESLNREVLMNHVESSIGDLVNLMTYNSEDNIRRKAFTASSMLHRKVEFSARRILYLALAKEAERTANVSLKAWLITLLKDTVMENLKRGIPCQDFSQEALFRLCKSLQLLEITEQTDLIREKEQILATVNFFGCLLIYDNENATGVAELKTQLTSFHDKLKAKIALDKAFYAKELELASSGSTGESSYYVAPLGGIRMGREEYCEHVQNALNALQLMLFNISRFEF